MLSRYEPIDRATAWLERVNARSGAALLRRPDWWHITKIVFGALFMMRSVHIALDAPGLGRYALASFWLLGGAYLVHGGIRVLGARGAAPDTRARWRP